MPYPAMLILAGHLNRELSSLISLPPKARDPSLPNCFTYRLERKRVIHAFLKGISTEWMQTALVIIWTVFAGSIFYYITHTWLKMINFILSHLQPMK